MRKTKTRKISPLAIANFAKNSARLAKAKTLGIRQLKGSFEKFRQTSRNYYRKKNDQNARAVLNSLNVFSLKLSELTIFARSFGDRLTANRGESLLFRVSQKKEIIKKRHPRLNTKP